VFRTLGDQVSLWEAVPPDCDVGGRVGPVDVLLDDPVFFGPFEPFFDPRIGRPSTAMETYLRLMFLKFRYGLGFLTQTRTLVTNLVTPAMQTALGRVSEGRLSW